MTFKFLGKKPPVEPERPYAEWAYRDKREAHFRGALLEARQLIWDWHEMGAKEFDIKYPDLRPFSHFNRRLDEMLRVTAGSNNDAGETPAPREGPIVTQEELNNSRGVKA